MSITLRSITLESKYYHPSQGNGDRGARTLGDPNLISPKIYDEIKIPGVGDRNDTAE